MNTHTYTMAWQTHTMAWQTHTQWRRGLLHQELTYVSLSTASLSVRKAGGHPSVEDSLNQRLGCVAEGGGDSGVRIETCIYK